MKIVIILILSIMSACVSKNRSVKEMGEVRPDNGRRSIPLIKWGNDKPLQPIKPKRSWKNMTEAEIEFLRTLKEEKYIVLFRVLKDDVDEFFDVLERDGVKLPFSRE